MCLNHLVHFYGGTEIGIDREMPVALVFERDAVDNSDHLLLPQTTLLFLACLLFLIPGTPFYVTPLHSHILQIPLFPGNL